jgi:clan AA aspartic protease
MITGVVTADREAVIRIKVRGRSGREEELVAVVDTGFDGWLSLPRVQIARLGLPWRRRGRAILADGRETVFDIYEGTVIWDRKPRRVTVDEADVMPLIGMALMGGYELTMEVRAGGKVFIKGLKQRS